MVLMLGTHKVSVPEGRLCASEGQSQPRRVDITGGCRDFTLHQTGNVYPLLIDGDHLVSNVPFPKETSPLPLKEN